MNDKKNNKRNRCTIKDIENWNHYHDHAIRSTETNITTTITTTTTTIARSTITSTTSPPTTTSSSCCC